MNTVQAITQTGLLGTADLADILGTTERSVQRWARGDFEPRRDVLDHLLEVQAVTDLAGQVMDRAARLWLRSPAPALDYDKPVNLLRDREYRRVIAALTAVSDTRRTE